MHARVSTTSTTVYEATVYGTYTSDGLDIYTLHEDRRATATGESVRTAESPESCHLWSVVCVECVVAVGASGWVHIISCLCFCLPDWQDYVERYRFSTS
jgi:hypothetical protein